jgi:hypothetical protein
MMVISCVCRVYFVHDHVAVSRTVVLSWEGGSMELTPAHRILVSMHPPPSHASL